MNDSLAAADVQVLLGEPVHEHAGTQHVPTSRRVPCVRTVHAR
jgi:hypothetical protein